MKFRITYTIVSTTTVEDTDYDDFDELSTEEKVEQIKEIEEDNGLDPSILDDAKVDIKVEPIS